VKRIVNELCLLSITIPIAFFLGVGLTFLDKMGRIRILHKERFPFWKRRLIVVSNHPSLLETVIIPILFYPEFCLNPFWYSPYSTPDKRNFYDRWYWFWARPRLIPIDRSNGRSEGRSLRDMKEILDKQGIIVIFGEGGRTFKGKEDEFLYSKYGKRIRRLTNGLGWLVSRTKAHILPIWVEGTDSILLNHPGKLFAGINLRGKASIRIGNILRLNASRRFGSTKQITNKIEEALLALADEQE